MPPLTDLKKPQTTLYPFMTLSSDKPRVGSKYSVQRLQNVESAGSFVPSSPRLTQHNLLVISPALLPCFLIKPEM